MARKKKPPEHENLERWLVSYADFMTLLFATFVVLYALSQINVNEFKKVEDSLKKAFSAQSILDGGSGVMSSGNSVMDTSAGDSVIDTLLMEYISPRYEQQSYEEIEKTIEDMTKSGEMDGVSAKVDDRGFVITITDKNGVVFKSGSAELSPKAKTILEKVGKLIVEKFAMHLIKVEGHTDSMPVSGKYPSNWELSSARASGIVRYLIGRFKIPPEMMSAVGYADTRPIVNEKNTAAYAKNRRVEIVVQRNQYKNLDHFQNTYLKLNKSDQQKKRNEQLRIIKEIDNKELQSLGDDVKPIGTSKPSAYVEKDSAFLNESKRVDKMTKTN